MRAREGVQFQLPFQRPRSTPFRAILSFLLSCIEASYTKQTRKIKKNPQTNPKQGTKRRTIHANTSLAMVVVEYDFFERGLPDLPTPLLSSSSACARTPDLASASTCGPQQPEVAPMPMMKTRRGRFRRKEAVGFAAENHRRCCRRLATKTREKAKTPPLPLLLRRYSPPP